MDEKKLIALAGKAAGYNFDWDRVSRRFYVQHIPGIAREMWRRWDPLYDDGDAFRLAVDLDLTIFRPGSQPGVLVKTNEVQITYSDDCVRRAILIAASAIGKLREST